MQQNFRAPESRLVPKEERTRICSAQIKLDAPQRHAFSLTMLSHHLPGIPGLQTEDDFTLNHVKFDHNDTVFPRDGTEIEDCADCALPWRCNDDSLTMTLCMGRRCW